MREEQLTAYLKGAFQGRQRTIKSAELEHALDMSGTFRAPAQAQRSGLRGKRRRDGAGELFAARRKRASAVRDDERKLVNKLRRKAVPICSGRDGYFYAKNAGDILRTIRALRVMIKGLQAAVDGLVAAPDKFEETPGVPAETRQSGLGGERRSSEVSESCRKRQDEGYGACDDEGGGGGV